MFHRVRDVNFPAINSRFFQCLVHDFPSRSNKRFTLLIFVIARLLADQHDRHVFRSLAKHGLRGPLVEMTCRAFERCLSHLGQA